MRGKLRISFLLRVPDEYNSGIKTYWFCPYQINFLYIPVLFVIQTDHEEGATQKEQQGQSMVELPSCKKGSGYYSYFGLSFPTHWYSRAEVEFLVKY